MPAISIPSPKKAQFYPNALIEPIKQFVRSPDAAWESIARTPMSHVQLFERYAFLIAIVPAVSLSLGLVMSGKVTLAAGLIRIALAYLVALGLLYGATYGALLLAPLFGGKISPDNAAKLVVYSMIPLYILSVFLLVPALKMLAIAGVSGLFLFYRGIPIMTGMSSERQLTYFGANIVCWMVGLEIIRNVLF